MLTYRQWRCCNHSTIKLVHTLYHIMAIPCIAVGLIAVFDFHSNKKPTPIPNLYSLHSWMGLVTVGLYGLQVLPAVNKPCFLHFVDVGVTTNCKYCMNGGL